MRALVTGATGFLGSHIAERLIQRGDSVRALVRPASRTSFLESLGGVEFVQGDVTQAPTLTTALEGVDVVYHAAAMVSDWGPWRDFKSVTVNGTRNMLKAAVAAGTPRFLYVSTDGVYRYPDLHHGVTEESPLETRFGPLDYYRRSKTAAELIARRFQAAGKIAVSIVRPALILGERDAAMLPGLIAFLKSSSAAYMGTGRNVLPCVYAGDVADLCILAATKPEAVGQTYNAVNPEHVTQRDLLETAAAAIGVAPPKRSIPFRLLYAIAVGMEAAARVRGWGHRPELTRFSANLIGLDYVESAEKAMRDLGWRPQVSMQEAVRRSVEWARSHRAQPVSG
ncbi:MAG TPA: NAD-dependent epimerase/dehydratase family protein [Dehalococcoidia bacterium]|jgi:nucleoside-diphosphate-sugar epimerase|nr:NAD-dependent epimerase/dehydratase family protein [Dehalococcoidia bacterium]